MEIELRFEVLVFSEEDILDEQEVAIAIMNAVSELYPSSVTGVLPINKQANGQT